MISVLMIEYKHQVVVKYTALKWRHLSVLVPPTITNSTVCSYSIHAGIRGGGY